MAVIPYSIKENKTLGTHSFYTQAQSFSTLTCDDMKDEIVEGLGISPDLIPTIIKRYMRVAIRGVQRGHRVRLADELTLYPQLSCSVKDELDDQGNVLRAATADMINVQTGKSSIGATITQAVQQEFSRNVSWKRVGDTTDDTAPASDDPDTSTPGGAGSGSSSADDPGNEGD
ncbi:MAG: hypothetical protein IJ551_09980 [Prevotella sp.]|nr:hypothetical protein [Prevotella sp.]